MLFKPESHCSKALTTRLRDKCIYIVIVTSDEKRSQIPRINCYGFCLVSMSMAPEGAGTVTSVRRQDTMAEYPDKK